MEKYYDLIVSLIKENRRYPGCENILDDIVQDVYAHAEVVLNTVSNESVISSYLSKIVSTSMITVSKKMGIASQKSHAPVIPVIPEETESETPLVENDEDTPDTTDDTSDNDDSEYELDNQQPELDENQLLEDVDLQEEIFPQQEEEVEPLNEAQFEEESIESESDESDTDVVEDLLNEPEAYELKVDETENILDETESSALDDSNNVEPLSEYEEPEQQVDKTLVDKMINGLPADDEILDAPEIDVDLDSDIDTAILSESDITEENLLTEEFEGIQDEQNIVDDLYETSESETEEKEDSNTSLAENTEFRVPTYKNFVFTAEKEEIDTSTLIPEIDALASKNPDLDIFGIFRLKYQEKLSISDIAKKLDIQEEDVLKALNELMYIVKE